MKGKTHLFALATCALALGCAAPPYKPPAAGVPQATLKLIAGKGLNYGFARLYDNPDCSNYYGYLRFGNGEPGAIAKLLESGPYGPEITVAIPATGRQYLHVWQFSAGGMYTSRCTTTVAFDPVQNGSYELVFDFDTRTCTTRVLQLDASTGARTRERTAQRAPTQCTVPHS